MNNETMNNFQYFQRSSIHFTFNIPLRVTATSSKNSSVLLQSFLSGVVLPVTRMARSLVILPSSTVLITALSSFRAHS